jgi:DNA-binding transcriptional regulator of glucitol operon
MSGAKPRPRWFFLITPRWLAWHAFAVFAAWGMLWLGDWQFHRAEGGNALSWAYTFEWPIFTIFGVVFWAKTIIDEYRSPGPTVKSGAEAALAQVESMALPGAAHAPAQHDDEADDDPELAAYNSYLAKLNSRPGSR